MWRENNNPIGETYEHVTYLSGQFLLCVSEVDTREIEFAPERVKQFYAEYSRCADMLPVVSWNFKHIVHFEKISLYNAINRIYGYGEIFINSPLEVIRYDDETV